MITCSICPQHLLHVSDHGIEIQHPWLQYLPAAKGQELARQRGGPVGGFPDLFEVLAQWIVLVDAHQQEFTVTRDGRQQVVEVVSHPSRQSADGLHLLRLEELLLQSLALGDVQYLGDCLHFPR